MDADEALARQLQEEELRLAQGSAASQEEAKGDMLRALTDALRRVKQAEDPTLQAIALSLMPLDEMQEAAHIAHQLNTEPGAPGALGQEDFLACELLTWFKQKFFSWVDREACRTCASLNTKNIGVVAPEGSEVTHLASRVELYACPVCTTVTRFPRYNDVGKLLETRKGRCGEWANCFLLCCRAAGLTARYIYDVTDHVWTEYYSSALKRWVHLDSCEAAADKPLLYEAGWGKALSYVLAVGIDGAVDVTRRYTRKWEQVALRRTRVPEAWLAQRLTDMTATLRQGLPGPRLTLLELRDMEEQLALLAAATEHLNVADLAGLGGRTTGSEEWRQARGEMGGVAGTGAGAACATPAAADAAANACTSGFAPVPPPATMWVPAPKALAGPGEAGTVGSSGGVAAAAGRLLGGACRASGENGSGEGCRNAFDGRTTTKWLDFGSAGPTGSAWLEYRLLAPQAGAAQPQVLVAYDLVSANDSPERDPASWVLEGLPAAASEGPSATQGEPAWVELDKRSGVAFSGRFALLTFWLPPSARMPCTRWRLRITATHDPPAANSVQLACWNLYAGGAAAQVPVLPAAAGAGAGGQPDVAGAAAKVQEAAKAMLLSPEQLELLKKMVANIQDPAAPTKFRRVRASKTRGLDSHPEALALLFAVGFRPLVTLPATEAGPGPESGQEDVFLVVGPGPEVAQRAAAAVKALS